MHNVFLIFFLFIVVSEDLDGVPMYPSSSPSIRPKQVAKATTSKWETDTPVLASSKWDNPDLESDHSEPAFKKKNRDYEDIFTDADAKVSDDDLDGTPLDDSSQETIHHNSDKFVFLFHISSCILYFLYKYIYIYFLQLSYKSTDTF